MKKAIQISIAIILIAIFVVAGVGAIFLNFSSNSNRNNSNNSTMSDTQNQRRLDNGLIIEDLVVGNGKEIQSGNVITAHYKGMLEDGKVFDQSYGGQPFQVQIGAGRVIPGWDQGIPGMKVGGKRKLIIPSDLAYGSQGVPQAGIPGGATLIFEVEVLDVR